MYLLFEEDGGFKTGTLLTEQESSLQVETASGKRTKIKAQAALLRFRDPAPSQLLVLAEPLAAEVEPEFLWECCSDGEFLFHDIACEYYGHTPSAVEAAAILLALQAAPVYFHRKGKGRFRKAPADIVKAALAGLEKKRQQALAVERIAADLASGRLPPELLGGGASLLSELLYRPDRNKTEAKALDEACKISGKTPPELFLACGALKSAYDYHFGRFLGEFFPKGTGFPEVVLPDPASDLPLAEAPAFSIDDAATTEIDDAFSVQTLPGVGYRVGIHIAAPGLAVAPQSEIDQIARRRLSTVYMPGNKITMLPDAVVERFTLSAGRTCPALSLYLTVSPELEVVAHESRLDRVRIAANLRHHEVEPLFNAETLAAGLGEFVFRDELKLLWQLACACEGRRGKPSAMQGMHDYNFAILGDLTDPASCRVEISERQRGSPLDKLVAELMIVANSTWGGWLAEKRTACIYRAQGGGRVRMTTSPLPHEGLGVAQYAWCTSPLRRYVDLLNQWQLIALIRGETPAFGQKSELLFAAMRDFDVTYAGYADFQRQMERYWCLRWLQQEGCSELTARTLRREGMVKADRLPLAVAAPSVPACPPGTHVRLAVGKRDELTLEVDLRYVETLADALAVEEVDLVETLDPAGEGETLVPEAEALGVPEAPATDDAATAPATSTEADAV
jgi:exoribonuclease II